MSADVLHTIGEIMITVGQVTIMLLDRLPEVSDKLLYTCLLQSSVERLSVLHQAAFWNIREGSVVLASI